MTDLDNILSGIGGSIADDLERKLYGKPEPHERRFADQIEEDERDAFRQRMLSSGRPAYDLAYYPDGPVLDAYVKDRSWWSTIMGPFGSGKTIATVAKLMAMMTEVPVSRSSYTRKAPCGVRQSRLLVIRESYGQLERTTLKDWMTVFPDNLGQVKRGSKIEQDVKFTLPDGSMVHCYVEFVPLDRLQDLTRVTGAQLTFAWANETREIMMELLDTLIGRTGRYPNKSEVGRYFFGLVGDYNAPSEGSELCELREHKIPPGDEFWRIEGEFENGGSVVYWKAKPRPNEPDHPANFPESQDNADYAMFRQPGGLLLNSDGSGFKVNPDAENLTNLPGGYYSRMAQRSFPWVYVNAANLYGRVSHGRPVHPAYKSMVHTAEVEYTRDRELFAGFDAGRTPAFILGMKVLNGVDVFFEKLGVGSAEVFARDLKEDLWTQFKIRPEDIKAVFCDPRGGDGGQATDDTPMLMLQGQGFNAVPSPCNNDPQIRRAALDGPLTELRSDGLPKVRIHPRCVLLREALAGGYHYKLIQTPGGGTKYSEKPDKNESSHPAEACEYLFVGLGYGFTYMLKSESTNKRAARMASVSTHYRDRS